MKKRVPMIILILLLLAGCTQSPPLPQLPESNTLPQTAEIPEEEKKAEVLLQQQETEKEEELRLEALENTAISRAQELKLQYFYEEALQCLSDPEIADRAAVSAAREQIEAEKESLVNFEGDIPHIFFHSLIVYPEMIFIDTLTPMGGYNSGFSEKAELEKILPQLYERGYVLYDLDRLYIKGQDGMERCDILLPPGKTPLILSVDDVAYAYGPGFAQRLFLDESGALLYEVLNPKGETEIMPDGDVMGVVDAFCELHPDFCYQGHKGTIALTGFQGAFGYYPYTDDAQYELDPAIVAELSGIVEALKNDGWNFASHSYTHNGVNNYFCQGCSPDKMEYDIGKWLRNVTQYTGETRLFIAPFGFRVPQPALQKILDRGFDIYCTVDDKIYNEINDDYFLMSRIEISGYSMTYYSDLLNSTFFNVDEVFDRQGRPPVI